MQQSAGFFGFNQEREVPHNPEEEFTDSGRLSFGRFGSGRLSFGRLIISRLRL